MANGQEKGTTESKEGGEGAAKSAGDDMFDMEQD